MQRFFDYSQPLGDFFGQTDQRFHLAHGNDVVPAEIDPGEQVPLVGIRAVLWDIYGTLFQIAAGDLEQSVTEQDKLAQAAATLIDTFEIRQVVESAYPHRPPEQAIRDEYLAGIARSHEASKRQGVESPEVRIEWVWHEILLRCLKAGYLPPIPEPTIDTATRWAYLFDTAMQRTAFYDGAAETLVELAGRGMVQGIISNAQFYTPLHLRRLLRHSLGREQLEIEEILMEDVVFFSFELGYSKPDRTLFRLALERLRRHGITNEETVYIGNDMLNDVWAAKEEGIHTVLFAGDSSQLKLRQDQPCCQDLTADLTVTSLGEIPQLLYSGTPETETDS